MNITIAPASVSQSVIPGYEVDHGVRMSCAHREPAARG